MVHRAEDEISILHLSDRPHAGHRRSDRRADDGAFRNRRVDRSLASELIGEPERNCETGAIFNPESNVDWSFDARSSLHAVERQRIGEAAAPPIEPGETVILDSGSTTIEIAHHLPEDRDITVVTCADIPPADASTTVRDLRGPVVPRDLRRPFREGASGTKLRDCRDQAGSNRVGTRRHAGLRFEQVRQRRAGVDLAARHGGAGDHRYDQISADQLAWLRTEEGIAVEVV